MLQNLESIIKNRKSIRTYENKPIDPATKEQILNFMGENSVGLYGNKVEFCWIDADAAEFGNVKLGTYGVIKGVRYFLSAKINTSPFCFEDFGYCMEKLILKCAELNLGTCWLGGTYKKSAFSAALDLKGNEIIPAVVSVGYFGEKKSWVDKAFRYLSEGDKRKPFGELFFSKTFSLQLSDAEFEKYGFCLEMLRLAPSASNKQPWRVLLKDGVFHFYLKRTPNYNKLKDTDLQRVDMGIAMAHFDLALTEKGIIHRWFLEVPVMESDDLVEYISSCEVNAIS